MFVPAFRFSFHALIDIHESLPIALSSNIFFPFTQHKSETLILSIYSMPIYNLLCNNYTQFNLCQHYLHVVGLMVSFKFLTRYSKAKSSLRHPLIHSQELATYVKTYCR